MDKKELIKQAERLKGCNPGLQQLKECKSVDELINCFYDRIDFCLAHNFPSREYVKKHYQAEAEKAGIYIDRKWRFSNPNTLVLLGKSDVEIEFDEYTVSRLYVKHDTQLTIIATGNAFVVVDALDDSNVRVFLSDNARVIGNVYGNADCIGATRINKKHRDTYDLQTE